MLVASEALTMAWPAAPRSFSPLVVAGFFVLNATVLGVAIALMILPLARGRRTLADALKREHERSEELLLNVLPPKIAARLKSTPGTIADRFDAATVLFADIVGFTQLSARLEPEALVKLLDEVFSVFDALAQRHGLEKIKTIGDAYMVAAGIPEARPDHSAAVAEMALDMHAAMRRWPGLRLRIGMHSGPVVAGVIGRRKFSYDLWGDTVNTASRMESHGLPGEIQLSDACRAALADGFLTEERGVVDLKGKGPMRTWWLKGRRGKTG